MAGEGANYTYLPLEDARRAIGQKVNLFAIVTEIGVPRMSRGTDYVLTLKIVDPSFQALGISVNFFFDQPEKLPRVKSSGDIICLRCVMICIHKGDVYSLFSKKSSSFALFDGKNGSNFVPYQTAAKFKSLPEDDEFISELRRWMLTHQADSDGYTLQLNGIKSDMVFDLVCKVLNVHEASEGGWVLFSWDGTDAPVVGLQTDLDPEGEDAFPLHVESFSLPRDIIRAFPCYGTIFRIFAIDNFEEITQLQKGNGQWVRFRNITCKIHSGIWKGVLLNSSKIRFLSNEDDIVLARQRSYNARVSCEREHNNLTRPLCTYPKPSDVTETDYEKVLGASLRESLAYHEVTHKFKCVVRVVGVYPWKAEDLRSSNGGHYRMRLTLEDPTARIHAYLHSDNAVKFFGGYLPPEELAVKMNKLLGITDGSETDEANDDRLTLRNPPWVEMCLMSYYLVKSNPWESRKYQVYATKLVG